MMTADLAELLCELYYLLLVTVRWRNCCRCVDINSWI